LAAAIEILSTSHKTSRSLPNFAQKKSEHFNSTNSFFFCGLFVPNIKNMDDIEKLEHLSLVQKVVSELYNHTGLHEQVLGMKRTLIKEENKQN
jgi:hypothetical protein